MKKNGAICLKSPNPNTRVGAWGRQYTYGSNKARNQLLETKLSGHTKINYTYDHHGNMKALPHLQSLEWNHQDELVRVKLDLSGNLVHYNYDGGGQRTRKTITKNGLKQKERLYLGLVERYQEYDSNGVVTLERWTLQVEGLAQVDTLTVRHAIGLSSPRPVARYQYRDHLGSSTIEANEHGQVISYEEYYPYGASAYRASSSSADLSLKRYRFTGKERDEETGLDYFGVRYYASWLGRWTSADPGGFVDGLNLYRYAQNNPVNGVDAMGYNTDPPPLDPNGGALPEGAIVNSRFTQEYSALIGGEGFAAPPIGSVRSYQLPTEGGGWITHTAMFNKDTGLFTGYKAGAEVLDEDADNMVVNQVQGEGQARFNAIYEQKRFESGKLYLGVTLGVVALAGMGALISLTGAASSAAQATFTMTSLGTRVPFLTQIASRIASPIANFALRNPKSAQFLMGAADSIALESIASGVANTYRGYEVVPSDFSGDIDLADATIAGIVNMIPGIPAHYKAGIELVGSITFDFNLRGEGAVIGSERKPFENVLIEAFTGAVGVGFKNISFRDFDITGNMSIKNYANRQMERMFPNYSISSISREIRQMFYDTATITYNKAVKFDLYGDIFLKSLEIPGKAINNVRKNGE